MVFVLGLGPMYLSLGLACANNGFLAIMVLMLGLGAAAGGIYFARWSMD